MTASPALWTARVILAAALGIGIAVVLTGSPTRPSTPMAAAAPPPPTVQPRKERPAGPAAIAPRPAHAATPGPDVVKRVLDTGGPIRYGDWFWDEAGVPPGKVIVTVDTAANVLSIFRDGYEIGTAAVIYGADEKPTPLGRFPILQKDADHVSSLYGAPMPYTLRLTADGVSIHGSKVAFDAATHGCIGIPTPFAKKLFAAVRLGDEVIITRGSVTPATG